MECGEVACVIGGRGALVVVPLAAERVGQRDVVRRAHAQLGDVARRDLGELDDVGLQLAHRHRRVGNARIREELLVVHEQQGVDGDGQRVGLALILIALECGRHERSRIKAVCLHVVIERLQDALRRPRTNR